MKEKLDSAINVVKKIFDWIFKYRYWIAIIIFILCIIFELSGSSIGAWGTFIQTDQTDDGVIFGKSREVRSDEWAVLTPMTFSQSFDGFNYFSNIIRADKTDVAMVYALPIMNFIQIFRPFQLGYLFLGIAKGLSFFWYGRFIALFLVMIELFMILTKKNKVLSVIGAFLITLAPIVQWWFAVNGIAEIFIFGGLAIILLYKYMNTDSLKKRCLYLFFLYICAGGYLLVLYPAWQIPMFYIFLAIAIWVIVQNRKNCKMNYKDFISIGITILAFALTMGYIFYNSFDTIKAVMGTVYPGSRAETGGGVGTYFFQYPMNIFLPFKEAGLLINLSESSVVFGLFPIGIILTCIVLFKEKKKDLLLILFSILYIIFSVWCIWGFPEILAKLTLLSNSQAKRAFLAVGVLDVLLLIRSLSLMEKPLKRIPSIIISVVLTILMVFMCEKNNHEYVTLKMGIAMGIMLIYLFYMALRYKAKYANICFSAGIIFVMLMSGLTVNPVRKGVDNIYNSNIIKKVQEINNNENGNWIVEELGFPIGNYILMAGVPVINSSNTYPDLERWQKIDTESKYEDIYNRYSHISIKIRNNDNMPAEKFELLGPDYMNVYLTPEEIKSLDVKYIFTVNNLEDFNTNNLKFEKIYEYNSYKIYGLLSE